MRVHSTTPSWYNPARWDIRYPVEWSAELEQENRRQIPQFFEDAAGLLPPTQTPATTSKTLAFRIIHHVLLFSLNEPDDWDIRNAELDSSGMYSDFERPYIEAIESIQIALHRCRSQSWKASTPRRDFWGVLRDERCLAFSK